MQPPEDEDDSWVKKHPIFFSIVWSHGMRILFLIIPLRPDLKTECVLVEVALRIVPVTIEP